MRVAAAPIGPGRLRGPKGKLVEPSPAPPCMCTSTSRICTALGKLKSAHGAYNGEMGIIFDGGDLSEENAWVSFRGRASNETGGQAAGMVPGHRVTTSSPGLHSRDVDVGGSRPRLGRVVSDPENGSGLVEAATRSPS
jgi:hypothetical protein